MVCRVSECYDVVHLFASSVVPSSLDNALLTFLYPHRNDEYLILVGELARIGIMRIIITTTIVASALMDLDKIVLAVEAVGLEMKTAKMEWSLYLTWQAYLLSLSPFLRPMPLLSTGIASSPLPKTVQSEQDVELAVAKASTLLPSPARAVLPAHTVMALDALHVFQGPTQTSTEGLLVSYIIYNQFVVVQVSEFNIVKK